MTLEELKKNNEKLTEDVAYFREYCNVAIKEIAYKRSEIRDRNRRIAELQKELDEAKEFIESVFKCVGRLELVNCMGEYNVIAAENLLEKEKCYRCGSTKHLHLEKGRWYCHTCYQYLGD